MLLDFIRKVVPINLRQDLGLWTANQAGQSKLLAYPYFYFLCGTTPKNLKLLPNNLCSVTYNGTEIVAPRDGILAFIEVLQQDTYEKYWTPKPTDVVLDVGAYVGMFSVKVASKVAKVIAIEPSKTNYNLLRENTLYTRKIVACKCAASNCREQVKLYLSSASACHTLIRDHKDYETVEAITLDELTKNLGYEHVDFIKIDAEGAELKILQGAGRLLNGNIQLAVAAYHNLESGKLEKPYLLEFLISRNFIIKNEKDYIYAEHTRELYHWKLEKE